MTTRPSLLVTRKLPQLVEDRLSQQYDVCLNADDTPLSKAELLKALQEFDALCPTITDQIDAEMLSHPKVKTRIIANFGAGFEHIDLEAAQSAGITVTNTPGALTEATANLAMMLILMLSRRASEGEMELRSGGWKGWHPVHMMGQDVAGKTLGLVGYGKIARALAKKASSAFGLKIIYHSRTDYGNENGAEYDPDLLSLAARCDFLSLHIPGGKATRHMINAEVLGKMKPTSYLINTARGSSVDEAALANALHDHSIAGAGLDVFENEPNIHPRLLSAPNATIIPHLGSATLETRTGMGLQSADNLEAFFAGKTPPNRII